MSYLGYVARRAAFAIASVYAIVTLVLAMGTVIVREDLQNALANARWNGADPAELAQLERRLTATFGLDEPWIDRLVGWWIDVTTFDWGYSTAFDRPVRAVLDGRIVTTLEYVVPGVLLAIALGVLAGLLAALRTNGRFDWSVRVGAYALLGIPAFMLGFYGLALSGSEFGLLGGWYLVVHPLNDMTIAALAVALGLLAGQLRFARAAALEQTGEAFVKMLKAKGAGRLRLARHVLRNAALPIMSLSITELLAVLVLDIYAIEAVLGVPGFARASLRAVGVVEGGGFGSATVIADVPLLLWSVLLVVFIGITASFLQDVVAGYLDPRIGSE